MAQLKIDDLLVEVGLRLSGHRDPNEMVAQALTEYIQRLQQQELISFLTDPVFAPSAAEAARPTGE